MDQKIDAKTYQQRFYHEKKMTHIGEKKDKKGKETKVYHLGDCGIDEKLY